MPSVAVGLAARRTTRPRAEDLAAWSDDRFPQIPERASCPQMARCSPRAGRAHHLAACNSSSTPSSDAVVSRPPGSSPLGVATQRLDVAVMYGRIVRVKSGAVGAALRFRVEAVAAHRAGGRLACVSALAFHGVIERGAHRAPRAPHASWVTKWRSPRQSEHVVAALESQARGRATGSRSASTTAWAQFALCRAVAGRDVRLRRTDSL